MTTTMQQYVKKDNMAMDITEIIQSNVELIHLATHRSEEEMLDPELIEAMVPNYEEAERAVARLETEEQVRDALAATAVLLAIIVTLAQERQDG